ncbi:MAG: LPS export ABC transporter permease LptF [Betaproteobacteria bacterium]|nr:MAG: LPS export ABC transporter permease LptF [Betaproteobacteria bacterium]
MFRRSLLREFGNLAVAVFATLFAITLTTQLIRYLGQAASGKLLSEAVLALLGFSALNYLPVLLSLTLFISVLMTISRSYRDSEMVIWFSAGLPLTAWVRPVLIFAAPLVFVIALLSLFLAPWANKQSEEYRRQLDSRDELSRIAPGVFRESANAERVFFVEGVAGDSGKVQNVFVASMQHGRLGVMVSRRGFTEAAANGDRFIVLADGRRYEGNPGEAEYRVMEFKRYAVRIETREAQSGQIPARALSTQTLLEEPHQGNLAELLWRIGLPLGALNLALLAIPLAFVNPRASRSTNLVFALLTYMVYSNLISVSQAWVSQGRISFHIGWWVVHVAMLLLLLALFYRRMSIRSAFRRAH